VTQDDGTQDDGTWDDGTQDDGTWDDETQDDETRDDETRDAGTRDAGTRDAGTRDGVRGLALAVSWLTVLPVPVRWLATDARPASNAQTARDTAADPDAPAHPDAPAPEIALAPGVAAAAIRWAPVIGLLLGAAAGCVLLGLATLGVPPLVAGLLTVGFLALATRGMHLDGLADTADGLGCYGPPERALAVMRDGAAGPFAVVTLIVMLGVQAAALATLASRGTFAVLALGLAAAAGRAGFSWVCRRRVPAARPGGLGASVAGSQRWWVAVLWWGVLAVAGYGVAGPRGLLAFALAAAAVALLSRHTGRRLGGMTGDVLGAGNELATTIVLVALAAA
jgi:adenosylcobinamide-GDP ribazoletransferase